MFFEGFKDIFRISLKLDMCAILYGYTEKYNDKLLILCIKIILLSAFNT